MPKRFFHNPPKIGDTIRNGIIEIEYRGEQDGHAVYHARVAGRPGYWSAGSTVAGAIGALWLSHNEMVVLAAAEDLDPEPGALVVLCRRDDEATPIMRDGRLVDEFLWRPVAKGEGQP